ncbi:MAG: hypothetical protein ACD_61C00042G0008 [uncultured bacterium]|nr:MAG: hypothetical protein ACD_61C00042G0008 [uncultured bacterium]
MTIIKAVIFDLNGVFLKSESFSKRLAEKTGKDADAIYEVMKPILKEVRNPERRGEEVWTPLLDLLGMPLPEFFDFYFSGETIDEEMLKFAGDLKNRGLRIFILSNNFRERTGYYRKNFPQLFEVADKVYFSWETGFVKPDPEAYKNLLEENGLQGEECVYIDDSEENLEVAKELKIRGIKYESGEQIKETIIGMGVDPENRVPRN